MESIVTRETTATTGGRPLRVVIQAEDYLPNIGGIAAHVDSLARGLATAGHSVTILSTRKDVPAPRNVTVFAGRRSRLQAGLDLVEIPVVYTPRNLATALQLRIRFTGLVRRLVASGRCDVVHFHFWDFDSRVVAPLRGSVPIVFTNHSSHFLEARTRPEMVGVLRERVAFSDAIISPSLELLESTVAIGYPRERCRYVPNWTDVHRNTPDAAGSVAARKALGIDPRATVLLCARRPVAKNGLVYFCQALLRLAARLEGLVVLFAGLSPRESDLHPDAYKRDLWDLLDQAREAGVDVRLAGPLDPAAMRQAYLATDVSVLPSLVEATSLTGLESMAHGLPVVGTRTGGIPEIIQDEETGLLVPPADPAGLAEAIERLCLDRSLRERIGAAGRRRVEAEFSVEHGVRRVVDTYRYAIASRT